MSGFATSPLRRSLFASHDSFLAERPPGSDEDVHMLSEVVDHVIVRCSEPGEVVLDPFAGFGTSIQRAIELGREALGIELLPERVEYLRRRTPAARIVEGDSREVARLIGDLEQQVSGANIDLILTSPPYMTAEHHAADPLTAYEKDDGDYGRYLTELGLIASQCAHIVKPGGFVVWNVADIHHRRRTTHLISDCTRVLEQHLDHVGTTEIEWDQHPHDLVSDALLVFQRPTRNSHIEAPCRPS